MIQSTSYGALQQPVIEQPDNVNFHKPINFKLYTTSTSHSTANNCNSSGSSIHIICNTLQTSLSAVSYCQLFPHFISIICNTTSTCISPGSYRHITPTTTPSSPNDNQQCEPNIDNDQKVSDFATIVSIVCSMPQPHISNKDNILKNKQHSEILKKKDSTY